MKKNLYYIILRLIYNNTDDIIIEVKNIFSCKYKLEIDNSSYDIDVNEIKNINLSSLDFNIIISYEEEKILFKENFKIPEIKGFYEDSLLETMNGPKKISNISSGDIILNKDGKNINVEFVYLLKLIENNNNYPIKILKSKCGINLPYQDLIMSIKINLKVRKVFLKGRNLYLNKKAIIFKYKDPFYFYLIETENKNDFLINGFITESI